MSRQRFIDAGVVVLVLCAILQTGFIVRRETQPAGASPAPRQIKNWKKYAVGTLVTGPSSPKVTLVEFADFQCPFCSKYASTLKQVQSEYPDAVALTYRHFPLEKIHPHAMGAAIAAECAGKQGLFTAYHDELYSAQNSIGVKSWSSFAQDAGVRDSAQFDVCIGEKQTAERVAVDVVAARELGLTGTPALLVNGELRSGALSIEELRAIIQKHLR